MTGRQIAKARKLAGLTQEQVARKARITIHRLTYFETNRTRLTDDEITRIRRCLREAVERAAKQIGSTEVLVGATKNG